MENISELKQHLHAVTQTRQDIKCNVSAFHLAYQEIDAEY